MEIKQSKRGGKRSGAGRKKNSLSAKDIVLREAVQAVIERSDGCLDPVDAMREVAEWGLRRWRDMTSSPPENLDAAKMQMAWAALVMDWQSKAAPYVRPRLNAIEAKVSVSVTVYERIERANQRFIAA